MYTQYYNILTEEEYKICKKIIDNSEWEPTGKSTRNTTKYFYVIRNLKDYDFFSKTFFSKIEQLTNKKFHIIHINANGHKFNQPGDWHTDSSSIKDWTFLYYFNKENSEYIGGTSFKNGNSIITSNPIFNSGVFFKSDISHMGLSPSILLEELRITIAFKLREKDYDINVKLL